LRIEVAVPTPVHGTFAYLSEQAVEAGVRVLVPFGARKLIGVSLGQIPDSVSIDPKIDLKRLDKVVDETPVYSESLLRLGRWLSDYYLHPLGEVYRTMLPASSEKQKKSTIELTDKGKVQRDRPDADETSQLLQKIFKRKAEIARATIINNLRKLLGSSDAAQDALIQWRRRGLVTAKKGTSVKARLIVNSDGAGEDATSTVSQLNRVALNELQAQVLSTIWERGIQHESAARKPFLLWGVTGSGKTEIYLHAIEKLLTDDPKAQALVLVPEISLTPQMTRVFEQRFLNCVAVVHSAMSDSDRWEQMQRVRRGEARVLIGPRSAVFAPFQKLRLILVDEEHDSSYKQSTGLAYNGRDVAIVRSKFDGATVVLGSATPSIESFQNARSGKYVLLQLPKRALGSPLPSVALVQSETSRIGDVVARDSRMLDVAADDDHGAVHQQIVDALRKTISQGEQAMVLVNRRGYSLYLFSLEKRQPVCCPNCSISLTTHNRTRLLRCHYCDYSIELAQLIASRPNETLVAMGFGSQKIEHLLGKQIPEMRMCRIDSDTVTSRDRLPMILADFRGGKVDVLVGTQMLAKGHDFPKVTLIAILEVDQMLNFPDFRAGERTFQLIVQAAGRAGRAELPGHVMVQAMKSDHPVIQLALAQDYAGFAERELKFREEHSYPPFSRLIYFEWNSQSKELISEFADRIEGWVGRFEAMHPELAKVVRVFGPTPPPIEFVRGRHRRTVLLSSKDNAGLRRVAKALIAAFDRMPGDVRMKVDVDPQSVV
jgi:primosomal protein N' (replication factor Y)